MLRRPDSSSQQTTETGADPPAHMFSHSGKLRQSQLLQLFVCAKERHSRDSGSRAEQQPCNAPSFLRRSSHEKRLKLDCPGTGQQRGHRAAACTIPILLCSRARSQATRFSIGRGKSHQDK